MSGPWDGFGSPADRGLVHEADLFSNYTLCGMNRHDVSWSSVTTRITCAMCAMESASGGDGG